MKSKAAASEATTQLARDINHTFAAPNQQYCPIYPNLTSTQIHPSTLAVAYYPNFLPAWRTPSPTIAPLNNQPNEANLAFINPRPPHITLIGTSRPNQNQPRQIEAPPPPPAQMPQPKNKPNQENQVNPPHHSQLSE